MRVSKKRKQKNNAPHSQKGATLLRIRSLRKDNDKRAFTNASVQKTKAEKQRAPFPKGRNAVAHPLAPEDNNKRA